MTPHIVSFVTVDDTKTLEESPEVNHNTTQANETHCRKKRSKKDDNIVNIIVPKEASIAEKLRAGESISDDTLKCQMEILCIYCEIVLTLQVYLINPLQLSISSINYIICREPSFFQKWMMVRKKEKQRMQKRTKGLI